MERVKTSSAKPPEAAGSRMHLKQLRYYLLQFCVFSCIILYFGSSIYDSELQKPSLEPGSAVSDTNISEKDEISPQGSGVRLSKQFLSQEERRESVHKNSSEKQVVVSAPGKTVPVSTHLNIKDYCSDPDLDLQLPGYYKDGAVFQANQPSQVWGFANSKLCPVKIVRICEGPTQNVTSQIVTDFEQSETKAGYFIWRTLLDPADMSVVCGLQFMLGAMKKEVKDVIYGDIWFCSGQSNMRLGMEHMLNSTQEISASSGYNNIRMFFAYRPEDFKLAEDLDDHQKQEGKWFLPNKTGRLKMFSAICFMYARYMTDQLQRATGKTPILGLISSTYNTSPIEAWMSPESLKACRVNNKNNLFDNSQLYNRMIHPFIRHTIKGILWYQGEANSGYNTKLYRCTFLELVRNWRSLWARCGSDKNLPFGFVQVANDVNREVEDLRWHQTNDTGRVSAESNMFMAMSMDTYTKGGGGIHPVLKQPVAKRLAITGGHVAYGLLENPLNGPFPHTINVKASQKELNIYYPKIPGITYKALGDFSGFYSCCVSYDSCQKHAKEWTKIMKSAVVTVSANMIKLDMSLSCGGKHSDLSGLAYLWEDTPIRSYLAAPIYSKDSFKMPAAPWKKKLAFMSKVDQNLQVP